MPHDYNAPRRTNNSPIARARIAKGWTQAQLADALGVIQQQVARWENGESEPRTKTLIRIGDALGVDWTTLVDA